MSRSLFYVLDQDNNPIPVSDPEVWGRALAGDRRVAEDQVGRFWVSTVFLVIDHGWTGPPLVFETMVFAGGKLDDDRVQCRYSTWDEAEAGHRLVVDELRQMLVDEARTPAERRLSGE